MPQLRRKKGKEEAISPTGLLAECVRCNCPREGTFESSFDELVHGVPVNTLGGLGRTGVLSSMHCVILSHLTGS